MVCLEQGHHFLLDGVATFTLVSLVGPGFHRVGRTLLNPQFRLPFPTLPHKYRILHTWPPWQGRAKFETCNTHRWILTKGQKYDGELRHLHRNHSVVTTYRRFFEAQSVYISICKHNMSNCSRHNGHVPTSRKATHLPGQEKSSVSKTNGDHLVKYQFTTKTGVKTLNSLLVQKYPGYEMTVRARAISTNHWLRRCPWQGHARIGRGRKGDQHQVPSPQGARPVRSRHKTARNPSFLWDQF